MMLKISYNTYLNDNKLIDALILLLLIIKKISKFLKILSITLKKKSIIFYQCPS